MIREALRAAIRDTLLADAALIALLGSARVYGEPPRDVKFPYITVDPKDGDESELTISVWSSGGGHKEVHRLTNEVLSALDRGEPTVLKGYQAVYTQYALRDVRRVEGRIYHGLIWFRAVCEAE